MKKFEFIEHTADFGIRVYGESLEDLFKNSAQVLSELLTDYKPKQLKEKEIQLQGETLEDLYVIWLNELISAFFADKFLLGDCSITIEEDQDKKVLKAAIKGQDFNPYENKINMEIKAATYHNLKIEKTDEGFKVEVIFDV
jgi:SHS2 domain-containing protein